MRDVMTSPEAAGKVAGMTKADASTVDIMKSFSVDGWRAKGNFLEVALDCEKMMLIENTVNDTA